MSRRCLLVTQAHPSSTGGPEWRRLRMFADFYASLGYSLGLLVLTDSDPSPDEVRHARAFVRDAAFAQPGDAGLVAERLDARWAFDLFHFATLSAPGWLGARRNGVRVTDGLTALYDAGRLSERSVHSDLLVADAAEEMQFAAETGVPIATASYLRDARRFPLLRIGGAQTRAGCWVENDGAAIASVNSLFEAFGRRGGGAPPAFLLAGPGARHVNPPTGPTPPTVLDETLSERAFYRGLDVALFTSESGPPGVRYDLTTALELGATPLVASSALRGVNEDWRLPRFGDHDALAEYLFERGRDLRDGGLLAELRARADWTWSGLQRTGAAQRTALASAIREKLVEKTSV